ncbi:helix-turn-helix domain-containing protein [Nocardia callitridis]|uniref:HTH cro/C1-type domain-containing protein n=1 Tax=Nocardia callitridis TaxID=648753 RepID=A0ABP9KMS0_9NOCA
MGERVAKMGRRKRSRLTSGGFQPHTIANETVTETAITEKKGAEQADATKAATTKAPPATAAERTSPPATAENGAADTNTRDLDALGAAVRERRRELKLTQAEISGKGGPSAKAVSEIERSRTPLPQPETLDKLDVALDWTPGTADALLRGANELVGAAS